MRQQDAESFVHKCCPRDCYECDIFIYLDYYYYYCVCHKGGSSKQNLNQVKSKKEQMLSRWQTIDEHYSHPRPQTQLHTRLHRAPLAP